MLQIIDTRILYIFAFVALIAVACTADNSSETDHIKLINGIWVENLEDEPVLMVEDDSICVIEGPMTPLILRIRGDSMFIDGKTNKFKILRLDDDSLWLAGTNIEGTLKLFRLKE